MWNKMKIIDAHHHFISKNSIDDSEKRMGPEEVEKFKKKYPKEFEFYKSIPEEKGRAKQLLSSMDENRIDQVILMARDSEIDACFKIHKQYSDKFPGVIPFLNPENENNPEIIEEWVKNGAVTVKLYPGQWQKLNLSSPELLPFFKKVLKKDHRQ